MLFSFKCSLFMMDSFGSPLCSLPVLMVRCGYGNFRLRAACCQETCRGSNVHFCCFPHNCTIKMAFILYERIQTSCLALTNDLYIHANLYLHSKQWPALPKTKSEHDVYGMKSNQICSFVFSCNQMTVSLHIFPCSIRDNACAHSQTLAHTHNYLQSGRTSREVRQDFSR